MKYIKAKFEKSLRPYTYKTEDNVVPGDIVQTEKGVKLTVVDEKADMDWVKHYGDQMVAVVKKIDVSAKAEESEEE